MDIKDFTENKLKGLSTAVLDRIKKLLRKSSAMPEEMD